MKSLGDFLKRWVYALAMMVIIFAFSSIPSYSMPSFEWWDLLVKKGGHVVVYSLLALSFWHGMDYRIEKIGLAWGLSVIYAVFDEIHQSFVPGRNAWWVDVVIDSTAAGIALWMASKWRVNQKERD